MNMTQDTVKMIFPATGLDTEIEQYVADDTNELVSEVADGGAHQCLRLQIARGRPFGKKRFPVRTTLMEAVNG